MTEIWKSYPRNAIYEVSDMGRVLNYKTGKFLAGSVRPDGYHQVKLGRGDYWLLHRLVLFVFRGPSDLKGLHRDDIKSHNYLSNLYYGNSKQNADDRVRNNRARGRDAANAKLTREDVLEICRRLDTGEKIKSIAAAFDLGTMTVTHINCGHSWAWLTGRSGANARLSNHPNHAGYRRSNSTGVVT